jgi:26S proteasome regulatory subunit N2
MATALTSAASIIALLDEPDTELQVHALTSLDTLVDVFWAEIARAIEKM